MPWDRIFQAVVWAFGVFLAAVWLSRGLIVWRNRKTVPDISTPEYDVPLRIPTAPKEGGIGHPSLDRALPRVSIIVPARNEAEHIESALLSLLQLDYPDYEVIAVDDRSEDATGAIMDRLSSQWRDCGEASHHRLKVLHVTELPQGWLGKVHAMWTAAQQATGEWLLFTDADVVFRPDALRRAMIHAERERADHVVLFPTMVMESIGERMMMAFFQSQFVFAHRPWKVADPKSGDAVGVGAFNLLRKPVYESVGTYAALRMAVLDDMMLGGLVKQHGFRQRCVFGRDLLRLRWVVGTMGMVRGLTKNFFAILRFNVLFATAAICGVLLINAGPFVGIWFAHGWVRAGYGAALLAIAAMYFGMATKSDIPARYFFLHPVGTVLFAFAMVRSMIVTLARRGIEWRGTFYRLEELKRFGRGLPRSSWI
jgi:glycosyltransferase involved in cell wall biosynthesis